jgi:hypothetical protein
MWRVRLTRPFHSSCKERLRRCRCLRQMQPGQQRGWTVNAATAIRFGSFGSARPRHNSICVPTPKLERSPTAPGEFNRREDHTGRKNSMKMTSFSSVGFDSSWRRVNCSHRLSCGCNAGPFVENYLLPQPFNAMSDVRRGAFTRLLPEPVILSRTNFELLEEEPRDASHDSRFAVAFRWRRGGR